MSQCQQIVRPLLKMTDDIDIVIKSPMLNNHENYVFMTFYAATFGLLVRALTCDALEMSPLSSGMFS